MPIADNPRIKKAVGAEKIVITGLIVSSNFCAEVTPLLDPMMFPSSWMKTIASLCVEYYKTYGVPVKQNLEGLYASSIDMIAESDQQIIEQYLVELSEEYSRAEASFNDIFYIDEAIQFIKKAAIEKHIQDLQGRLVRGQIDDAIDDIAGFKSVSRVVSKVTYASDPGNYGIIKYAGEDDARVVLEYPGALGQMVGKLRRSWLVAFLAPMKRGKSNFLLESAVLAARQGRKVLVALHEMQKDEWFDRLFYNIASHILGDDQFKLIPQFDCIMNRDGTCTHAGRVVREPYQKARNPKYRACTLCEHIANGPYKPCVTTPPVLMPGGTTVEARASIEKFDWCRNIVVEKFATRTANSRTLRAYAQRLAYQEGFIPDVIISDHADNQGLEDKRVTDKLQAIDDTWINLKWLADETNALVLTATQGTRGALAKDDIEQTDVSGYIGKAAHLDAMFGLAQNKDEKAVGIIRLNSLYHRHAACNDSTYCTVLQRLDCGKYLLDSRLGTFSV